MIGVVGHDHQEDEIGVFNASIGRLDRGQDLLVVVVLDARRERLEQILLVLCGLIKHRANVCVLHADVEALGEGEVVELVVNVVSVLHVLLKADDGEALERTRLVHHRVQAVRVVECA